MNRRCPYGLPALLMTVWILLPGPPSSAGVMVPFKSDGMFDFNRTAETAIAYANAYLKRQAAEEPAGGQLRLEGSSTAAIGNLERMVQQTPNDLNLQTALGSTLFGVSRSKEAQRVFEQAVRTNPLYAIGHCYLAYLALLYDDRSGFERHFEEAIQTDPTYLPAYNSLAMAYTGNGKSDAALRVLTQGVARFPNEASLFHNQALVYALQNRLEAAEVSLRNALTRQPTDNTHLMLGMILLKRDQWKPAQVVFESILEANPKNTFALAGLADSYKGRHDYAKAIALIEQAIAIDPHNADLQDELRIHKEAYEKWKNQRKEE
jgi:tetratricopeptide (TPR) repeat protein